MRLSVDYADLAVVDFSKFGTPEGRAQLALQVREAMAAHGFFCVINHGYSTEQVGVTDNIICFQILILTPLPR